MDTKKKTKFLALTDIWPMLGDGSPHVGPRRNPNYTRKGPGRYHPSKTKKERSDA